MILLAIDTASHLCAACIYDADAGVERGRSVRDIGKGHAEQLMDVIAETLAAAGATYPDLDGIAVSVGPGSFTGIRVGVAAARGLALGLNIPAVGVTTLEALVAEALAGEEAGRSPRRAVLAVNDAGREQVYVAYYSAWSSVLHPPRVMSIDEAVDLLKTIQEDVLLTGSAARKLDEAQQSISSFPVASEAGAADIATYARIAAGRLGETSGSVAKPRPLYLRGADAKPQAGFTLARKPG